MCGTQRGIEVSLSGEIVGLGANHTVAIDAAAAPDPDQISFVAHGRTDGINRIDRALIDNFPRTGAAATAETPTMVAFTPDAGIPFGLSALRGFG
jgi:hypothetical protein